MSVVGGTQVCATPSDCSLQVPQPSVLLENWLLKALRYSERLGFMELQRFYRGMEITEKCNWLNMTDGIR